MAARRKIHGTKRDRDMISALVHSQDTAGEAAGYFRYAAALATEQGRSPELIAALTKAANCADEAHQYMFDALGEVGITSEEEVVHKIGRITKVSFQRWLVATRAARAAAR